MLLASCWAALTGSALTPATGERQLSLISRDQEIRLGREAAHVVAYTISFVDAACRGNSTSSLRAGHERIDSRSNRNGSTSWSCASDCRRPLTGRAR